jgi:eukaryotic-like serine/threonine-protein kinase
MSPGDEHLIRVAEAITDEVAVDWEAQAREHPELAARLPGLRLLARIADVFHAPQLAGPPAATRGDEPTIATWGHLEIRAKLGEGGYGTVYRAHDPHLQRDVALKLLRDDLAGGQRHAHRILAEARLMARVKHRNVLVIHGADEHDGRIGFWMDLLEGDTLEAGLAAGEVLGAGEAALYGQELCRALGAVHGAGLVHGDVKAANVMRDRDGRIVLMDFGAGSESGGGADGVGPLSGTPLALAPELLAGGAPSPAGDLYALGALLYRLVTGRYPLTADSLAELRRKHAEGARTPLLDLRPDLPAGFVAVVERALAADPARRFRSAGELEASLAASQKEGCEPAADNRGRRRWPAVVGVAALLGLLAFFGWQALRNGSLEPAPVVTTPLTADASFQRTGGEVIETLAEGTLVRPGDTLGLTLQLGAAAHVYVLNEDRQGEVFVLFPLAETDLRNPLPAGRTLRLPGTWQGTGLDWQVTDGQGEERFLVIAAREPVGWLETQLAGYAAPARDRAIRYTRLDPGALPPDRGVGVVAEKAAPIKATISVLDGLAARLTDAGGRREGVWIYQLMLYNLGR